MGLLCLENFADAAELLQGVDHVGILQSAAMLSSLGTDWRLCVDGLRAWMEGEKAFGADETINLTPTSAARLLSRLMQPEGQPAGFSLDEHGFGTNGNAWGTYTQAASLNRGCSPFNLVDCFRHMAGVGKGTAKYELRRPSAELVRTVRQEIDDLGGTGNLVAFQLGASDNIRRWPTEFFAELGKRLQGLGLTPVLLGSAAEGELVARYRSHGGIGVDFMGRTSPARLAAALVNCQLLVTNDTGTMHLAAGLDVPLIAIFLATAQAWDTGPYRENTCCLEPRLACHPCSFGTICPHNNACRHSISAGALGDIVQHWWKTGSWSAAGADITARIWQTTRDAWGFLSLEPLSALDSHSDRTAWIHIQRTFYRQLLDTLGCQTDAAEIPTDAEERLDSRPAKNAYPAAQTPPLTRAEVWALSLSSERRERVRQTLANADGMLLLITEQARLLALRPLAKTRQTFLANCDRLATLLSEHGDFVPLSHLWRSMLQDRAGNWTSLLNFLIILRNKLAALSSQIT